MSQTLLPIDFVTLVAAFIKTVELNINIPLCLMHLISLFMISKETKPLLLIDFHLSDSIRCSLSSLSRIFTINRIFRIISFSIGTIVIDIYPYSNKYTLNHNHCKQIQTLIGTPWNFSNIQNAKKGIKFMVDLHRQTLESCKCTNYAYIQITIFSNNGNNPIHQNVFDEIPSHYFNFSSNDASIKIKLPSNHFRHHQALYITTYNGILNLFQQWTCKAMIQGICCVDAANEGCADDYILSDDELQFVLDERWRMITTNRQNAINKCFSKHALQ